MKAILAIIAILSWPVVSQAENLYVEVFADGEIKVPAMNGVTVMAFDLNEVTHMNANAPKFKRATVDQAKAAAQQWINSPDFSDYKKQVMRIRLPLMLMSKYQLSKIPAIVFNRGEYVIYGTTDVEVALTEWNRFMARAK